MELRIIVNKFRVPFPFKFRTKAIMLTCDYPGSIPVCGTRFENRRLEVLQIYTHPQVRFYPDDGSLRITTYAKLYTTRDPALAINCFGSDGWEKLSIW